MASRKTAAPAAAPISVQTQGFGVPQDSDDPHHFKVIIPRANSASVCIDEYLGEQAGRTEEPQIARVRLERKRWSAIRGEVQRAFNARLAARHLPPAAFCPGENRLDRLLGKELCVLAWAIEQLPQENIGLAVRNWLALRPEERWWLFGMTALQSGQADDAGKGWRLALQHALGDVAQSEEQAPAPIPRRTRQRLEDARQAVLQWSEGPTP